MVEGEPPFPAAATGAFGQMRRVGHDINAVWLNMISLVDLVSGLWPYAHNGSSHSHQEAWFNELEMMQVANGDFIAEQGEEARNRVEAHFTMWAVLKSPLIISTDLQKVGPDTMAVLMNREAIGINQDPLGVQAKRVVSRQPWDTSLAYPRDVVATAAVCREGKVTQQWRWTLLGNASDTGLLWTRDSDGRSWCLGFTSSGIWSVAPYDEGRKVCTYIDGTGGNITAQWKVNETRPGQYSFTWPTRTEGFGWSTDVGASGPLPHTRWLLSAHPGEWRGDLKAAMTTSGTSFRPATESIIDDDNVGNVTHRAASDFCLDVSYAGNLEVWVGPLSHGRHAVAILNRSPSLENFDVDWKEIGVPPARAVRDVWAGADRGTREARYTTKVPAHGVVLLILS